MFILYIVAVTSISMQLFWSLSTVIGVRPLCMILISFRTFIMIGTDGFYRPLFSMLRHSTKLYCVSFLFYSPNKNLPHSRTEMGQTWRIHELTLFALKFSPLGEWILPAWALASTRFLFEPFQNVCDSSTVSSIFNNRTTNFKCRLIDGQLLEANFLLLLYYSFIETPRTNFPLGRRVNARLDSFNCFPVYRRNVQHRFCFAYFSSVNYILWNYSFLFTLYKFNNENI